MTSLVVENIAKEKIDLGDKMIGPNVIEATMRGFTFQFPDAAALKSEMETAEKIGTTIGTNFIQYFYQVKNNYSITIEKNRQSITKKFSKLMKKYPNHIIDINFDFIKGFKITPKETSTILQIQRDVNSPFLSHIEANKEQTLEKFVSELENIKNPHNQILCPGIDLDTVTPDLFAEKLDYILEKKFPRFNVKYASLYTRYGNWLDLSERIFGKDVWCNLTSVPRGHFFLMPPHRSLLACSFLYGIHTASHGLRRHPKKSDDTKPEKKKSEYTTHLLNPNSLYYNEVSMSYENSIADSMNILCSELKNMREHVVKDTFVTKYLPTKAALLDELHDLKGRV